jgi:hypothetical protein
VVRQLAAGVRVWYFCWNYTGHWYLKLRSDTLLCPRCRPIVHVFAQVLKRKVLAASKSIAESKRSGADQKGIGALHWLDFYGDYLDAEGKLKEKYKLDGTHMSPEYVELLDREFRKVPAAEDK